MPRSEFGWSLCYLSEVSLVVAWLLKCNISRLFLWTSKHFLKQCGMHISCVQNRLFISSHFILYVTYSFIFKYTYIIIFFFMATKVNRSTKSIFLQISKNHNKKMDNQKKKLMSRYPPWSFLSLDFFRRDADLYSELGIVSKSNLGRPPIWHENHNHKTTKNYIIWKII